MKPLARWWLTFLSAVFPGAVAAQQVVLDSGDVLQGTVEKVAKNKATIKTTDGALRSVDVRSLSEARLADGTVKRYAAELLDGPIAAPAAALLARLKKGEALEVPDLFMLTRDCPRALFDELKTAVADKSPAVRAAAVQALAAAGTPETVRAALDAAGDDAALQRSAITAMTSGTCLGALDAAKATPDVEKLLASKDKTTRASAAWIGVKLGSAAAIPVLATFVNDPDHHVRESAATCLAEAGNDAGAKLLIAMCKRESSPAMAANRDADPATRDLVARGARAERIHSCELLGKLKHAAAVPTLRSLAAGKDQDVAIAAKNALAAIEAKSGG